MTEAAATGAEASAAPLRGPFGRKAVRLGRILNIDVGIDWSWLFIFALVSVSLVGVFGAAHEDWSEATRIGAALVASLAFFGSILLHELGHSVVSNALGLPVHSITLFLFGGLAKLGGKPGSPRDEFLIGAAGPAVSVLLGVLFLGLASVLPTEPRVLEATGVVCSWLGKINLVLAAFNLVPGHPLDGGHLMRAAVWQVSGNEQLATRVASAFGTGFAVLLMAFGAMSVLALGNLGGFWLVLIGWFLMRASQGTVLQAVLEERLGRIRTGDAMGTPCSVVSEDLTVEELVAGAILTRGERSFCVEHEGELVGLVTLKDVKHVPAAERASTPLSAIMVPRSGMSTISRDESLWEALKRMDDLGVNQLPVTDGERLVGLLTREQLLRVIRNQMDLGAR